MNRLQDVPKGGCLYRLGGGVAIATPEPIGSRLIPIPTE